MRSLSRLLESHYIYDMAIVVITMIYSIWIIYSPIGLLFYLKLKLRYN
jgi:hypothetical protein